MIFAGLLRTRRTTRAFSWKKAILAGIAVQLALWSPLVGAQKEERPVWEVGVGASALTIPYYRGSDGSRTSFFPIALPMIRSRYLRIDDQGLDSPLYTRPRFEFGFSGDLTFPGDSEDIDVREGMPDLGLVVQLGPALKILLWDRPAARQALVVGLPVRFAMAFDSGVDSIGQTFSPKLTYYRDIGWLGRIWRLGLSGGLEFGTDQYHEYYYQVDPEFATPERPAYEADAGYAGTRVLATFHSRGQRNWMSFFARYDRVDGATFEDSPLVASKDGWTVGALYTYFLLRSKRKVSVPPRGLPGGVERIPYDEEAQVATTEPREREGRNFPVHETKTLQLFPKQDLFPRYIADPRRATTAIALMYLPSTTVEEAGDSRLQLKMGGRYGLFRVHPMDEPNRGFQVDFEAGFSGVFDRDDSSNNIGWDGIVGLYGSWRLSERLSFRGGLYHVSSHVGDEYIEKTGRTRIGYTRAEWLFGVSYEFADGFRVYGEGAWGGDNSNEFIDKHPPRVQAGLEYVSGPTIANLLSWYVATDVSSFEENDWNVNFTLQGGIQLSADESSRVYRIGMEYYDGRTNIGEFFMDQDSYLSFGIWFEL